MAGMKGITVNTAPEAEPHIYAEDDAAIFQSIFGEDGVSSIGQACKATVLSNNKVRIADGVVFVGGHFARIPYGEYVDCEIANGQSGKNRNDIIVAKFVTTGSGGIDTMTYEVKQGTAGTTAADPALTQNDIYKGGKIREFPLYRVKIEGLNITAVEQLFTVVPTNEELIKTVAELNGKIADKMYRAKVLLKYYDSRWMYATINVGKQFAGSVPIVSMVYLSGTATINAINISAEQVKDDGNVTIWAYGSGFVSAHLLYAMIDCRSD
nr:MAG TPA: Receptor Binding Protein sandwich domain, phage receptor [Caudoviricetes sp.]